MPHPIPQTGEEWFREIERRTNRPKSFRDPVGTLKIGVWAEPPVGHLFADGQAVSRERYSALFDEIGTTHGVGNGTTTFNLPNIPTVNGVKYAIRV